jgi:HEAT repeat protein
MFITLEHRLAEIERLAARGGSEDVSELIELLGDQEWQTRRAAATAIANLIPALDDVEARDRIIIDLLHAVATAVNAPRRAAAIVAVEAIGRMALPHLAVALNEASPSTRTALAGVIGNAGGPGAVRLLEPLSQEEDQNVAAASILALGRTRAAEALPLLLSRLEGSDDWLKFASVGALGELGDGRGVPRVAELIGDPMFRETAIASLVEIGTVGAARALGAHVVGSDGAEIRVDVLTALVTVVLHARILPSPLAEAVQRVARQSIPEAARESLLLALEELLPTGETARINACLTALGWLREPEVLPAICELLRDCSFAPTAREILTTLANADAGPMSLVSLTPDQLPRLEAAQVLAEVRSPNTLEALLTLLNEAEDEETIAACLSALEGYADRLHQNSHLLSLEARERIYQLLRSAIAATATSAHTARMLGIMAAQFGSASIPELNRELMHFGGEIDGTLASLAFLTECDSPMAVAAAVKALRHRSARVRVAAIHTIARHSATPNRISLVTHLTDEAPAVRRAAARSQRYFGAGSEVRRMLAASLSDEDIWVRVESIGTLAALAGNDPTSARLLRAELNSAHPLCRVAAIEAQRAIDPPDWVKLKDLALHDQHAEVRTAALGLVAMNADRSVVASYLNRSLADADWAVRFTAIDLAIVHEHPELGESFIRVACDGTEVPAVRTHAIRALAQWSHPAAVRIAVSALADPSLVISEAAFEALARLCSTRADELEAHCPNSEPRAANHIDFILHGLGTDAASGVSAAFVPAPLDVYEQV